MSGKKSRNRGREGEYRAARLLTEWGAMGTVVRTAKAMQGTRLGDDLCREVEPRKFCGLPVSIEVKHGEASFTTDWIDQARRQGQETNRPWLLIWIPLHCRKGREWFIEEHPDGGWQMTWADVWMERNFQRFDEQRVDF